MPTYKSYRNNPGYPKRPIEKRSILFNPGNLGTTQSVTVLHTATLAETFSGARGNLTVSKGTITSQPRWLLAIVLVRDGQSISTLSTTVGSAPYEPEQDILWLVGGSWSDASTVEQWISFEIKIKAMRKLKEGDTLQIVGVGSAANSAKGVTGPLTMFFKQ